MNLKTMTVSSLNNYIKRIIDSDIILSNINVEGEVSNFTHHKSGHLYFSLKDNDSRIKCVMFKTQVDKMKVIPEDGDMVTIKGRVSVYPRDGGYQIYVEEMSLQGIGDLYVKFNELKERLYKEGLFNQEIKRKIPIKPHKIAVVTSPTGAAIRDIINVTKRRNKGQELVIYPVKVQGDTSTVEVIEALRRINQRDDIDLIIIARGGGSIEDLWSFNSELLAREIRNTKVPVISGIGHEIDTTIADLASDLRAATPSQAAELAVPVIDDHINTVKQLQRRIILIMNERMKSENNILAMNLRIVKRNDPGFIILNETERIDGLKNSLDSLIKNSILNKTSDLMLLKKTFDSSILSSRLKGQMDNIKNSKGRITMAMNSLIGYRKKELDSLSELLSAYNPDNILQKGYSIIISEDKKVISTVEGIDQNNTLILKVSDGERKIEKVNKHE